MIAQEDHERADGRTARRDRNREAVLDAALELFADDLLVPGPAEVAARSGVSLRSVYRYYEDMDALVRAAMARHLARIQPLFQVDGLGEGPLADRIERMVAARLRLYEAVAPMMRAALVRGNQHELIAARLVEQREAALAQVEAMFAPELGRLATGPRRELAAALDLVLEFEAMEHLRRRRGLSSAEARRVLVKLMTGLLPS